MDHTYVDEFQKPSGKRPLATFQDTEDHEPPKKRPSYGERLTLRVWKWLDLIPDSSGTGPDELRETSTGEVGVQRPATPPFSQWTPSTSHISEARTCYSCQTGITEKLLVQKSLYRYQHLNRNKIIYTIGGFGPPVPATVSAVCDLLQRHRDETDLSREQVLKERWFSRLLLFQKNGAWEYELQSWFRNHAFPSDEALYEAGLALQGRAPFVPDCVPGFAASNRVAVPQPDLLYGYDMIYNQIPAFTRLEGHDCEGLHPSIANVAGSYVGYPFCVIEIAPDGPEFGGGLWVAINECLGGAATCVEAINKLNRLVQERGGPEASQVDEAIFSVAANQYTAELLVSYIAPDECGDNCYYTRRVASFLLSDPDHFLKFRRYVKNIVDWGNGHRLRQILAALDYLVELESKEDEAVTEEEEPMTEEEEPMTRKEKEIMREGYNLRPRRRK
ncbi:hypothetical protein PG993_004236 [Apiospora rasikravindrae]|uniref:DUF7924 domain-containing protein n=1 Tax=Apiospora rasikravindrae TaxID=990691 RepID=A0ABR1TCS7_9PEZI